jgi:hypothetical protein
LSPFRQRSGSVKRKSDESASYASAAGAGIRPTPVFSAEKVENITVEIAKVTTLCDKVDTTLSGAEENPLKNIFMDINAAIRLLSNNQSEVVKLFSEKQQGQQ